MDVVGIVEGSDQEKRGLVGKGTIEQARPCRNTEESVRFLREQREGPFFLYFAHMHVHLPLLVAMIAEYDGTAE